ncbi:MAG: UDP-3-O-acyl-N-acetylglucosamine deacetylase [bacterium]|nr:UDP-3-O-acyl-N-acetylglucosamine deacetylase [bacterium]
MISYQRTIREKISCSGIGLHSGEKTKITLFPAEPDSGIRFRRTDVPGKDVLIEASYRNLATVNYATTLSKDGYRVQTVEHLLSALAGLGIDNLLIEIDSGEVPIMDGSAAPFVFLIQEAGVVEQPVPRKYIKIKKTIQVGTGDKFIKITPAKEFEVTYTIHFDHPLINTQQAHYVISEATFIRRISRARTFGFLHETQKLREAGLIKGGSLNNAIVVGDYHILNGGLRLEDEFVCHKIIDFLGDISLLGRPIIGHVTAYKAGHGLHALLVQEIAPYIHKWEFIPELEEKPTFSESILSHNQIIYPYPKTNLVATTAP